MPTLSAQVQISFAMHGPARDEIRMLCDCEMGLYIRAGRGITQTGHDGEGKQKSCPSFLALCGLGIWKGSSST